MTPMMKKMGVWAAIFAVLTAVAGVTGSLTGIWNFYDRVTASISAPDLESRAAIERFIAVNNNAKHFSYALNSPVADDTLYVHWKWAAHTGGEYCYYYVIDGADIDNSFYHAPVPGRCNPEGFSLADQPPGFGFNSSIGVKLPYMIPDGNYTLTYYHLEFDGYHDKHQLWVTYDPIPFEVVSE